MVDAFVVASYDSYVLEVLENKSNEEEEDDAGTDAMLYRRLQYM